MSEETNLNIENIPLKKWAFIDANNVVINVCNFKSNESIDLINEICQSQGGVNAVWCDNFVYAAPGATYHNDHFRPIKPFPSWLWGVDHLARYNWVAPIPHPDPYEDFHGWVWSEEEQNWINAN